MTLKYLGKPVKYSGDGNTNGNYRMIQCLEENIHFRSALVELKQELERKIKEEKEVEADARKAEQVYIVHRSKQHRYTLERISSLISKTLGEK